MSLCLTLKEQVTRYAYGDALSTAEEQTLRAHLAECTSCQDFVSFVRKSRAVARTDVTPEAGRTGCPSADELRLLEDGFLDHHVKSAADEIRQHILNCRWCRAEYLRLSNLVSEEIPDFVFNAAPSQTTANDAAADPSRAEFSRLIGEHAQYANRLESLTQKRYLTDDEKLEEVQLKKKKLLLKDQILRLQQSPPADKNKFA